MFLMILKCGLETVVSRSPSKTPLKRVFHLLRVVKSAPRFAVRVRESMNMAKCSSICRYHGRAIHTWTKPATNSYLSPLMRERSVMGNTVVCQMRRVFAPLECSIVRVGLRVRPAVVQQRQVDGYAFVLFANCANRTNTPNSTFTHGRFRANVANPRTQAAK